MDSMGPKIHDRVVSTISALSFLTKDKVFLVSKPLEVRCLGYVCSASLTLYLVEADISAQGGGSL